MKTQTRILDNRLYYSRKIELHRKGKKSRTVRITPILICPSVLITVRRVHYGEMSKAPTILLWHINPYRLFVATYCLYVYIKGIGSTQFVGWLVVWILWHINLCRLFNAKSIFMKIVLLQTIQFSMNTSLNGSKV